MSYPPDPNNPYGQQPQPPQQPGYGYPQQPPQGAPQDPYGQPQAGYAYPQQQGVPPQGGYGYPADPYGNAGYQQVPQAAYANWGQRVGAYLIDYLIVGLLPTILYIVAIASTASSIQTTYDSDGVAHVTSSGGGGSAVFILLAVVIGIAGGLFLCYKEGTTGQTPGKKVLGISLVRAADGQFLGFGLAIVRKIAHVADSFLCGLGYWFPLWDAKRQTFADKIMSTVVVTVPK